MNFFNYPIVRILLVVCFIIGLCVLAGLHFHFTGGTEGIDIGVGRGK